MNNAPYSTPSQSSPVAALRPQSSALAIASLICGVCSLILCLLALTGIPAIICGHMAKSRIKKSSGGLIGGGMATAGLIMGYISVVFTLLIPLSIPIIMKNAEMMDSSGFMGIAKDTMSLTSIRSEILDYEKEFKTYPDSLEQLESIYIKDEQQWIYFPGQDSSSNANNILIASQEYENEIILTLRIDGSILPLQKADYEAAVETQAAQ